jgi:hypothetical protein
VLPGREIAPGIREVVFADGAVYRGGMKGTLLHGKGEYVAKSFRYEGEFADGVKQGQGIYTWETGNRYEGPFADDRPNGVGKYTVRQRRHVPGRAQGRARSPVAAST